MMALFKTSKELALKCVVQYSLNKMTIWPETSLLFWRVLEVLLNDFYPQIVEYAYKESKRAP